jgi:hypothetical protein
MKSKRIFPPQLEDAEWLRAAYATRPLQEIADELGVGRNTIRNRCIKFGIERRPRAEHFQGTPKPIEQRRKMSQARKRFWDARPDRDEFRLKVSRGKTKHGLVNGGYRRVFDLERGRIRESRLVMERTLGRGLSPQEQVHHINGDKLDNRPENLMVLPNSEHQKLHNARRPRDKKGRFTKGFNP